MQQYNKTMQKVIHSDNVTREYTKDQNPNWPQVSDHLQRILKLEALDEEETNSLFNLIGDQPNIINSDLYAKDSYEAKYQLLYQNIRSIG